METYLILEGKVPADWSDGIIVSLFNRKGDALDWSNICGLKLIDYVRKVIEKVVKNIIYDTVKIDEMQFGFWPGQGTTDAIFILRQLQENYLTKHRKLYMALADFEKILDTVRQKILL